MSLDNLNDLYVEQLKDLYSAETQILKALPEMAKTASHPKLRDAFTHHERQTQEHVRRLETIFDDLGESPRGQHCKGMEGVLKEGQEMIKERADDAVKDAGLIAAAQRVEHYEMAGYGTVRTFADRLGHRNHADLLQRTLDEEGDTDHLLTRIAEQVVNPDAMR
jgi:ferritin-like metal-binding protein YciE